MFVQLATAADRDPVDWVSTILLWMLIAAGIALALVAIRVAFLGMRALRDRDAGRAPARPQPLSVSVSAMSGAAGTRNAPPVPPENPHSPPTPAIGTPRVRV